MVENYPAISLIIPIYNVANYLTRTLESVKNQTFKDFEVICVNDGSSDNSADIAKSFADTDERFRLINQENTGLSGARNTGLKNARGEYIMFLDGDDYYHKQCIEIALNAIKKAQTDICVFDYTRVTVQDVISDVIFDKEPEIKYIKNPALHLLKEFPEKIVLAWNKIYKRSLIGNTLFQPLNPNEDTIFMLELYLQLNKISCIENKMVYYVSNPNSITHKISSKKISFNMVMRNKYLIDIIEKFVNENHNHNSDIIKNLSKCHISLVKEAFKIMISKPLKQGKLIEKIKHNNVIYSLYLNDMEQYLKLLKFRQRIVFKLVEAKKYRLAKLLVF